MPLLIYFFLFLQLAIIAYVDYRSKRISNLWTILNLCLFSTLPFIWPELYEFSWKTFGIPLVFFVVGYISFLLKLVGAGDTKYLFGLFLMTPMPLHEALLLSLAYTTVLVGFSLFLVNTLKNFDKLILAWQTQSISLIKGVYGKKFSFAPVIFLSWIWFGWHLKIYRF